jgi:hypothetical protein
MMKVIIVLVAAVAMLSLVAAVAPAKASTSGMGDFYLPRDAVNDNDIIPPPTVVQNSGADNRRSTELDQFG